MANAFPDVIVAKQCAWVFRTGRNPAYVRITLVPARGSKVKEVGYPRSTIATRDDALKLAARLLESA